MVGGSALVIGAGIIGVNCAIALRQRGFDVSIVDDRGPGEATSFGNAGCIAVAEITPISMPGLLWQVPRMLLDLWREVASYPSPPEACLINYYSGDAKMGIHQDKDEQDFDAPVLSVSLGDTAIFRAGGRSRRDPTRKIELRSGDVVVLGGEDRLAFHGIDRILPGTSSLLAEGGRLNLTLRRVTK